MVDFQLSLNTESIESAYPAKPIIVTPDTPVSQVFGLLKKQKKGKVLICRDGILAGIFTERDALKLMARGADLDLPIEQVMVPNPVTLQPRDTVGEAIRKMSSGGYRRLPIVDDAGRPLGVTTVAGIVHFLVEHFPEMVYNLPPEPDAITHEREGA